MTFVFVVTFFGHDKNNAISVRLIHLYRTFDDDFKSHTKGA